MKLSIFVISMVVVSMFAVLFTQLNITFSDAYGSGFDNSSFVEYDKRVQLKEIANDINASINNIQTVNSDDTSLLQKGTAFVNGLVGGGWAIIKSSLVSMDIFTDLTTQSMNDLPTGESSNVLKETILIIGFLAVGFAVAALIVGQKT